MTQPAPFARFDRTSTQLLPVVGTFVSAGPALDYLISLTTFDHNFSPAHATLDLITVLLVLAVLIALLGIVNTLALSIVERTGELGLLRRRRDGSAPDTSHDPVGGAVHQPPCSGVRCPLGIAVGTALARVFLAGPGPAATVVLPGWQIPAYVAAAAITAVLAAAAPAHRAARLAILIAIVSE